MKDNDFIHELIEELLQGGMNPNEVGTHLAWLYQADLVEVAHRVARVNNYLFKGKRPTKRLHIKKTA